MGRHEDITALVFERAEQGQVPRRAGTSIVALGRSFMPSRRTERIEISGIAVPFVRHRTIREACESASVTVGLPVSGGFKLRNGTERSGRRAGECLRCFEVGRGREAEWSAA